MVLTKAPNSLNGRFKVFEETFVSPFEHETECDAFNYLEEIRSTHPLRDGWVEFTSSIKKLKNGKWIATRYHAKYE